MKKTKLAIVDDHEIFRKGLKIQLEEFDDVEIVCEAENGVDFIKKLQEKEVDMVFMDINMPLLNGIDTTKKVMEVNSEIKIIALSMFGEEEYLQSMLDAGARGFLLKNISRDELRKAIDTVNKGNSFFSNELLNILTNMFVTGGNKKETPDIVKLTKRELEVLSLICKGHTNQEIADLLFLSQRTIDGHRANIISKVGAKNTVSLVTYAIKNKLVNLD